MFTRSSTIVDHDVGTALVDLWNAPKTYKWLILSLSKGGDLIPQACRLAWWEEFGEEDLGKLIPSGNWTQRQRVEPCPPHVLKWDREQTYVNCISGGFMDLQHVTHLKTNLEVQIGIHHRCATKLRLLCHRDECRLQFKIIGDRKEYCDAWSSDMSPQSDVIS